MVKRHTSNVVYKNTVSIDRNTRLYVNSTFGVLTIIDSRSGSINDRNDQLVVALNDFELNELMDRYTYLQKRSPLQTMNDKTKKHLGSSKFHCHYANYSCTLECPPSTIYIGFE
jgi:hypothetical protein